MIIIDPIKDLQNPRKYTKSSIIINYVHCQFLCQIINNTLLNLILSCSFHIVHTAGLPGFYTDVINTIN